MNPSAPSAARVLSVAARLDHLREVAAFAERSLQDLGLPEEPRDKLFLAIDELATNILSYAYPGGNGEMSLRIERRGPLVTAELIDAGIPFDPTRQPEPDVSVPIEKRTVGGLGIHLARRMVDEMSYERDHGRNRTRLAIRLGGSP